MKELDAVARATRSLIYDAECIATVCLEQTEPDFVMLSDDVRLLADKLLPTEREVEGVKVALYRSKPNSEFIRKGEIAEPTAHQVGLRFARFVYVTICNAIAYSSESDRTPAGRTRITVDRLRSAWGEIRRSFAGCEFPFNEIRDLYSMIEVESIRADGITSPARQKSSQPPSSHSETDTEAADAQSR